MKYLVFLLAAIACAPVKSQPQFVGIDVNTGHHTFVQNTFHDDFESGSLSSAWTVLDRPDEAPGAVCFIPSRSVVSGGTLNLTAAVDSSCASHNYTSGQVMWTTFNYLYGKFTARVKFPGGSGPWPAVWLLGANCQDYYARTPDNVGRCVWPDDANDSAEIDIAEPLFSDHTHVNQQVHMTGSGDPGCNPSTADVSAGYHTYGLDWTATSLIWTIDGSTTCTITDSAAIPHHPMFMILDVAVGGCCGGTVIDATFPQTMSIDDVRVSQ